LDFEILWIILEPFFEIFPRLVKCLRIGRVVGIMERRLSRLVGCASAPPRQTKQHDQCPDGHWNLRLRCSPMNSHDECPDGVATRSRLIWENSFRRKADYRRNAR